MRNAVFFVGLAAMLAGGAAVPSQVLAAPIVLAQVEGGGVGGSLAAPETRTVRAKPRPSHAPAARAAPAPRVIVRREVIYEPRYVPRPAAPRPARPSATRSASVERFNGAWSVSSGGGCSAAGTGQVTISGGRVIAANGSGQVSPTGAVSTTSSYNGVTIVAQGQIAGQSASGVYRQSDGCSGTWSAVRL